MNTLTPSILTVEERQHLQRCEETIRRGLKTFLEVGQALQEIHDAQLYRETHRTFEDYCRAKWGLSYARCYELRTAAGIVQNLGNSQARLPENEAQANPLRTLRDEDGRMDPDLQRAAWSEVLEIAGDDPVTARLVEKVVARMKGEEEEPAETQETARRKRFSGIEPFAPEENTPPFPEGRFSVILADPPWRYDFSRDSSDAIEAHYSTMSLDDICNLSVPEHTTDDAVLFLWATSPKLPEAFKVIEKWGFTYKTSMVWEKQGAIGMGYYARIDHEFLLIAARGAPGVPQPKDRPRSVVRAPKGRHSVKPGVFHDLIERMYPAGRRLELFCRRARPGWTAWGNQADGPEGQPELDALEMERGVVLPLDALRVLDFEEEEIRV